MEKKFNDIKILNNSKNNINEDIQLVLNHKSLYDFIISDH
jgi:mannitol-specific phosphotransferase system IIBC component